MEACIFFSHEEERTRTDFNTPDARYRQNYANNKGWIVERIYLMRFWRVGWNP